MVMMRIRFDSGRGSDALCAKAMSHAEVDGRARMVSGWDEVEAEVGGVVSLEGAVNPEVGGSSGEGVEEMSESQNINGDFSGAVPSSSATGRVMNLDDGICRRFSDGRWRGVASVPS